MGKYTKEQIAAIVERKRKSRNREVFSEFIRISESDLYDWNTTGRLILLMIAFMQCNDEGSAARVSEGSPYKGHYTGWCFASQKRLAFRCGTSERWVREWIDRYVDDGVMQKRTWTDHLGYKHTEYHVIEEKVTEHHRGKPEEYLQQDRDSAPRRGGNKQANKGSFKKGNRAASRRKDQPLPQEDSAESERKGQAFAIGTHSRNPQEESAVSDTADPAVKPDAIQGDASVASLPTQTEGCCSSQSGSGRDLATYAAQQRKERQSVGDHAGKSKSKPTGSSGSEDRPPIPNYLRYPSLFKNRVDRYGKWLGGRVPRCPKCDGNLQPNESHDSVCAGYEPKLPNNDPEYREAMRESMHEQLRGRPQAIREERIEEAREREEELEVREME